MKTTKLYRTWTKLLLCLVLLLIAGSVFAQDNVTISEGPVDLRLYQRDAENVAEVKIKGSVNGGGKAVLKVYEGKKVIDQQEGKSPFSFTTTIEAKLSNYRFEINNVKIAEKVVCGDVFILNGQSNAEAFKPYESNPWVRTFGSSDVRPDHFKKTTWGVALAHKYNGQDSKLHHIGCWGVKLGDMLVEEFTIPVAIIQGARGGAPLADGKRAHMRNDENPEDAKTNYGRLLWRMRHAGLDKHAKAMFWHQGEASGGKASEAENYYKNFVAIMDDWAQDYPAMKTIYLFQTRPKGGGKLGHHVRESQRQLGLKHDAIHLMSTVGIGGYDGLHYHAEGYLEMAELLFPLVAKHQYGAEFKVPVSAPNLLKATYGNQAKTKVVLEFDQPVVLEDGAIAQIEIGGKSGLITSASFDGSSILLELSESVLKDSVSYANDSAKDEQETPVVRGENGIAALTFWQVCIQ